MNEDRTYASRNELADRLGTRPSTLRVWANRYESFPAPLSAEQLEERGASVHGSALHYDISEVESWHSEQGPRPGNYPDRTGPRTRKPARFKAFHLDI